MKICNAAIAAVAALIVVGCGTTASQIKAASQGDVIVVAVQDLRGANGRIMSDNAGGIPDALGRAVGVPIGTVAGAVLDVAIGTAANVAANKVVETTQPIEVKVISETSCEDWAHVVVRTAASPQTASLRPGSIARIGGDEFAVLLPRVDLPEDAARVAEKIIAAISQPFAFDGRSAIVGISIGIALYPAHGCSSETILSAADHAMYRAKQAGRNTYRFAGARV